MNIARSGWSARWRAAPPTLVAAALVAASLVATALVWVDGARAEAPAEEPIYDVVVYGGTAGGAAAAVQARRLGKTALLVEPGRHIGGLTSGGLGATDIGNKAAIGGVSREFYQRVKKHYDAPSAWRWQRAEDYKSNRQTGGEDAMWTFEPHVAEAILREMLREAGAAVMFGERLRRDPDNAAGVIVAEGRARALRFESGKQVRGRVFIDATYEGDLLAAAGVDFTVGREANARYGETLNGVQTKQAVHHQLRPGIDPYVRPGDPSSGLLAGVDPSGPGEEGAADHRVQAYNFRMCVTDAAENRAAFERPEGYDERDYELLFRNFAAGETRVPWAPTAMPNRKTDTNNNFGFSTDFIGQNHAWATASYAEREKLFLAHLRYQRGLMWTLANHERVPEAIRKEVGRWGNCKDEFPEHAGWSPQLYVREARRMVGDVVMTQRHCQGGVVAEDSVGLAAYTMDSHHVRRYVDARGHVRNEGDVQVGGFAPYPISYRALTPKKGQCANLLVPVCLSASHIAYGSIRMEPVFMALGQSAATAAALAIDDDVAVQDVDYAKLRRRLLADKQVLDWTGPRPAVGVDPGKLAGLVVDDAQAKLVGEWLPSNSVSGFVGARYLHDNAEGRGEKSAEFACPTRSPGLHEIRLAHTANANRATNVLVEVRHARGAQEFRVNQRKPPSIDGLFVSLGEFELDAKSTVVVRNKDADGHVVVDAVQFLPKAP